MREQDIIYRVKTLSKQDKQILYLKIKDLAANGTLKISSETPKRLIAFVKNKEVDDVNHLKNFLKKRLPDYMIPSAIHPIEEFPTLPNGKIDRHKIKTFKTPASRSIKTLEDPVIRTSEIEKKLISIWEEVLGFSPIHVDDNFFEIGGDSILSIQIISKARKEGIELKPNQLFEHQTISELALFSDSNLNDKKEINKKNIQETLITIWEEVLGFSPIHNDDNFFEIGGDSILSIQIISKARNAGIILKANQLFENQTIAELVMVAEMINESVNSDDTTIDLTGEVPLTPIQHWFFESHNIAPHYWNQIIEIQPSDKTTSKALEIISGELVANHESLRLSFEKTNDEWKVIVKPISEIKPYLKLSLIGNSMADQIQELEEKLTTIQEGTNLSEGSLFKLLYIDCKGIQPNKILIIAHHLVVDLVSWNIIFNDIVNTIKNKSEDYITNKISTSATIKHWSNYLEKLVPTVENEVSFWKSQNNKNEIFPTDFSTDQIMFSESSIFTNTKTLTTEQTNNLLYSANKTYNTKIDDLLITALINTIGEWSTQEKITLGLERQGRTLEKLDIDFSNTTGWFTSFFPITLNYSKTDNTEQHIKSVKEQLRTIPNNGLGFGILKYISKSNLDILGEIHPKIVFNYLGKTNSQNESDRLYFKFTNESISRHPESERNFEIEINAYIINEKLVTNWSFTNTLYKESTASVLTDSFIKHLNTIIEHCVSRDNIGYTPSDFPEADLNQDDLDNLLSQF